MDNNKPFKPFDWDSYIGEVVAGNKLAMRHNFVMTTCSGIGYLQGLLQQFRTASNFVCTTDTCEESTYLHSGGWFKRRLFITFILMRFNPRTMNDQADKMNIVRELFRQMLSRFVIDSERLGVNQNFINLRNIQSKELGGTFLNSCTGLYFQTYMDEPIDLCYNIEEWQK